MNELLAGAAEDQTRMSARTATTDNHQIGSVLASGLEQGVHRLAVDHQEAIGHRTPGQRLAPLLFQTGHDVVIDPDRRHHRCRSQVGQETPGMDGEDFAVCLFHQSCGPHEGAARTLRSVDAHHDATRHAHV